MNKLIMLLFAVLTACVTTPPPLRDCMEAVESIEQNHFAHGRKLAGIGQVASGTTIAVYYDAATEKFFGLLLAAPGALIPPEESEFHFMENCSVPEGTAHLYQAVFAGKPAL